MQCRSLGRCGVRSDLRCSGEHLALTGRSSRRSQNDGPWIDHGCFWRLIRNPPASRSRESGTARAILQSPAHPLQSSPPILDRIDPVAAFPPARPCNSARVGETAGIIKSAAAEVSPGSLPRHHPTFHFLCLLRLTSHKHLHNGQPRSHRDGIALPQAYLAQSVDT